MKLDIQVGQKFQFNHRGTEAVVTAIKGRKVKFEVFGSVPMYGSMDIKQFQHQFKGKREAA